jgi:tRNA nucleotidyltransferase/poly(A) polymerase
MSIPRKPRNKDEEKIFSILDEIDKISRQYGIVVFMVGGFCREEVLGHDHSLEDDCDMMADSTHGLLLAGVIAEHFSVPIEFRHRAGAAKLVVDGLSFDFQALMKNFDLLPLIRKLDLPQDYFTLNIFTRDFTINTLAMSLRSGKMYDLTGRAIQDLKAGILRTPLDAELSVKSNPMIMLRAIDFSVRFKFKMVPELKMAIRKHAPLVESLPTDSVENMINNKILKHDPVEGARLLKEYGF